MAKAPISQTIFLTEDGSVIAVTADNAATVPPFTSTPAPSFTTPSSIASDGTPQVGEQLTGVDGMASNASIYTRRWLLGSTVLATSNLYTPVSIGDHRFEVTATGSGGAATSSSTISVAAATPVPQAVLSLSSAVVQAETNSGTAAFVWTLTLIRDGSTSAYAYNWAVTGSGTNPANATDFGGILPSGSGTFAAGETTKTITVLVAGDTAVEPNETFTLTVTGTGLNTVTSTGTISNDDVADTAFTMSQLPSAKQVYQRQTFSGGGQNKGTGTVPVPVTVTSVGSPRFRIRASDGTTILQASTVLPAFTATGAQTLLVTGVDARLGWFYLDLSADGSTWQNGTVLVGMGADLGAAGQSQAVREFGKMPSYAGTNASLGVTIDPNCSVYARYTDSSRTVSTPVWASPADNSNYDSTFAAEFLRLQVASRGVNCALIGHAVGSTAISAWQPGTQNNIDLRAVLDAVGGFEAFYWHQGGDDAGAGTSAGAYKAGLSAVFGDLNSHNVARGSSFERYVTAMATRTSGGAGNTASVQTIRVAAAEWAASNGAVYLEPHDIVLEDAVHQGQPGGITLARHVHRATKPATDNGPTIASGTRSGTSIALTTSSALALVGSPTDRFAVYASGTSTTALAIASLSVSGTTITLNLSADPGTAQALDVYWLRHPDPSGPSAAANMIYDTYTADGLPNGRQLQPTLSGPIAVAAPGGTPTPTPAPTPTPTPSSSVMKDTFTATDGANLTSRPADTGQPWSAKSGTWSIVGNRARADGSGVVMLDAVVSSPNYDIEGDLTFLTSGSNDQNAFLIGHGSQDGANRFQAGYYGSLGRIWSIGVVTGNGYSNKTDVAASTVTNDVTYHIKMQCRLDTTTNRVTTTLIVDGTTIGSYVGDAGTYTSPGYTGIRQSGSSTPTATTGTRWDNFTVTPV